MSDSAYEALVTVSPPSTKLLTTVAESNTVVVLLTPAFMVKMMFDGIDCATVTLHICAKAATSTNDRIVAVCTTLSMRCKK